MRPLWRPDAHPIVLRVLIRLGELVFVAVITFALFALVFLTLSFGD